jgi:hypothetical protein
LIHPIIYSKTMLSKTASRIKTIRPILVCA